MFFIKMVFLAIDLKCNKILISAVFSFQKEEYYDA